MLKILLLHGRQNSGEPLGDSAVASSILIRSSGADPKLQQQIQLQPKHSCSDRRTAGVIGRHNVHIPEDKVEGQNCHISQLQ